MYVYGYIYTLEVKDYEHDGPQFWMMKVTKYLLKEMFFGENLLSVWSLDFQGVDNRVFPLGSSSNSGK